MTKPIPDLEASMWYFGELDDLEGLSIVEDGGETGAALHGEGEVQNPDDEVGRAWEDLEALTESA